MIKKIIAASAIGFFLLSGIAFANETDTTTDTPTEQTAPDAPTDDGPTEAPVAPKASK